MVKPKKNKMNVDNVLNLFKEIKNIQKNFISEVEKEGKAQAFEITKKFHQSFDDFLSINKNNLDEVRNFFKKSDKAINEYFKVQAIKGIGNNLNESAKQFAENYKNAVDVLINYTKSIFKSQYIKYLDENSTSLDSSSSLKNNNYLDLSSEDSLPKKKKSKSKKKSSKKDGIHIERLKKEKKEKSSKKKPNIRE